MRFWVHMYRCCWTGFSVFMESLSLFGSEGSPGLVDCEKVVFRVYHRG